MKVGDKLWLVPYNSRGAYTQGKEIVITRVGRDYVYSQQGWFDYKISKDGMRVLDRRGDLEGKCYFSEGAYKLELLRKAEWKRMQDYVHRTWSVPDGITLNEIMQVQVLLKMRKETSAPRPSLAERAYGEQQFFHD